MAMEPESTLVEFIRYNNWANLQVLAACQNLTESQHAALTPGAYGTIRDTLQHILRAETSYVRRMTGVGLQPPFKWEDKPSIADLAAFAPVVGELLLDTVQRVSPTQPVYHQTESKRNRYHARMLYIQIINHGVEHRTNVTTILSSLEQPAPEVKGWGYWRAHPERFDTALGLEPAN
jgi:uncharacterized damage-inducible protein DinB